MEVNYVEIDSNYDLAANLNYSTLNLEEVRLLVNSTAGPINIQLPAISGLGGSLNMKIYIVDVANTFGTNPVTINTAGTDTISGSAALILSENGAELQICIISKERWSAWLMGGNAVCIKTVKIANLSWQDLNSGGAGATWNQPYLASLPASASPYGGYYSITEQFTRTGAGAFTLNAYPLRALPGSPLFNDVCNLITNDVPASVQKFWVPSALTTILPKSPVPTDSWVQLQGSAANPKDFLTGNLEVWYQYIDFQI